MFYASNIIFNFNFSYMFNLVTKLNQNSIFLLFTSNLVELTTANFFVKQTHYVVCVDKDYFYPWKYFHVNARSLKSKIGSLELTCIFWIYRVTQWSYDNSFSFKLCVHQHDVIILNKGAEISIIMQYSS